MQLDPEIEINGETYIRLPDCGHNHHAFFLVARPKTIYQDIYYGWISGFPFCCIAYFLVRHWYLFNYLSAEQRHKLLGPAKVYPVGHVPKTRHILCPIHKLFLKLNWYKPDYNFCDCGWMELK